MLAEPITLRGRSVGIHRVGRKWILVCLAVVVAGCSGSGGEGSIAQTSGAESPSPPQSQVPQESDGLVEAADDGRASSHEDTLEQFAAMAGIEDPPEVEPIRVISQAEWSDLMFECLTEAGFPVTVGEHGDVGMEFASPDQMAAYDRAMYVCMAQYPVDTRHAEALTDDQLEIYYAWVLEHPVACMRERGHPVAEPPTLSTFIANYRARGELNFFADGLPVGQEAEIMNDVLEHCETEPPLEVLSTD